MKILVETIKYFALAFFVGIVAITIAAYLELPVPTKPLVVQTGSMGPYIPAGSLVVISERSADEVGVNYVENDVITFEKGNSLVSHRVVRVVRENGEKFFQTKGDANSAVDPELVAESAVVGKVVFAAPFVGKFVAFVKQPLGFLLLVAIPTLFIIISELFVIYEELRKKPKKKVSLPNIYKPITLTAMALVFVGSSFSYFSDVATSTSNTFTTAESFNTGIADHLVISEVQINGGPGDAEHDFIEMYNPTNNSIDLNGYRLVKRTGNAAVDTTIKSWTSSTMIPAKGFYLWANSSDNAFPSSISADTFTNSDLTASNSIALRFGSENSGLVIDSLSWNDGSTLGEGVVFDPDPGHDQSLERKATSSSTNISMAVGGLDQFKGNGFDSNNNATDFILRTTSQPQNSSSATESP